MGANGKNYFFCDYRNLYIWATPPPSMKGIVLLLLVVLISMGCTQQTNTNNQAQAPVPNNLTAPVATSPAGTANDTTPAPSGTPAPSNAAAGSTSDYADPATCNASADLISKDLCLVYVASTNKDVSLCAGVQDPGTRDGCVSGVAVAKRDPSLCPSLGDPFYVNNCYMQIAVAANDAAICNNIVDSFAKENCVTVAQAQSGQTN